MIKTIILLILATSCEEITNPEQSQNTDVDITQIESTNTRIDKEFYSFAYSESNEQAEYVIYKLTNRMINGDAERLSYFLKDNEVETETANNNDYLNSNYDRGHLMPAGDCLFDSLAMRQSFYYSNVTPQTASFNRGVWLSLERLARTYTYDFDTVLVITGGILTDSLKTIGENEVSVPEYFYKIIYCYNDNIFEYECYTYLLPNEKNKLSDEFLVSIDSVESLTGLDFFSDFTKEFQNKLEK